MIPPCPGLHSNRSERLWRSIRWSPRSSEVQAGLVVAHGGRLGKVLDPQLADGGGIQPVDAGRDALRLQAAASASVARTDWPIGRRL